MSSWPLTGLLALTFTISYTSEMWNSSKVPFTVRRMISPGFMKSGYSKQCMQWEWIQCNQFVVNFSRSVGCTTRRFQAGRTTTKMLNRCLGSLFGSRLISVGSRTTQQSAQGNMLPSNSKNKKKQNRKQDDIDNFNRDHLQGSFFRPFVIALCASLAFALLTQDEDEHKIYKAESSNSVLSKVKQLFVVNAAKPIGTDVGGEKPNTPPGKGGRRERFNFIADVVEAVQDSVVCIEVKDHSTVNWFGIPQGSSNGSGFIVKDDGVILTNAHVVAAHKQSSIMVKLYDGRCFAGYVEEVDYESDLATVRINARGLPTLKLGRSSDTRIGEFVVAMGSPLNLSNTVTSGIVSSTRGASEIGIHANDINYIQTDAAITFGNSGGPLINLDGEAIGINSMKVMPGISFAIPIDHAKKFLQRIELRKATGKITGSRRYMGVTILTITDQIRMELEAKSGVTGIRHGVVVWQVVVGSPSYLAGIKPGDIITNINGLQITSAAQVHDKIKVDDKLNITIRRGPKTLTLTVVPEHISGDD
ncbi:Serine protease HTRA2, mitochondrial [Orchesella cincta]|uniref:Serine protease HTRA2, mitochondrial n=1 Tax=Orchesella cincta TaxID=48709 RepID=A0A1D2NLN8_ORCCI|nr:Serine protease HTRA2, mitochondrial [Orchesella cincta]